MPYWNFKPEWTGKDCFIIGGGCSLKQFNFDILKGKTVLSVNNHGRVKTAIYYGDIGRPENPNELANNKAALEASRVPVYVNSEALQADYPWLRSVLHREVGLHTDAIGWNETSGAGAINLALLHGAKKLYLLGFDMQGDGINGEKISEHWFTIITWLFSRYVYRDWKKKFSDREIINVTDSSRLDCFPKIALKGWKP